jgi:predicted HAD superfamily phosphohydrolase YqeG
MDTFTDKPGFAPTIINKEDFNNIETPELQELFESLRNSMLEICPIENPSKIDDLSENFAERFAYIAMKGLQKYLEGFTKNFKQEIQQYILKQNNIDDKTSK